MAVQFLHGIDLAGTLELKSLSTNTSSTTALVMSGDEVQKRTLGTAAFVNTSDLNLSGDYVPLSGGSGTGQAMTGNLHIHSGSPIIYLKDTTDDDDQQINFQNNAGTVEYVIRTKDFTPAATGDGMFIGSISSDKLALVTNNTTALTIATNQNVSFSSSASFAGDITLDDGSGESPHIIFQDDDDVKFRVYNADSNQFFITREGNSGPDFVIYAHATNYTSSYLTIGGSTVSPTKIGQWNAAYNWGDHDSLYLPIGGGDLTGDLEIKKTDPKLTFYDNSGANGTPNGEIVFAELDGYENFKVRYNGASDRFEYWGLISGTSTLVGYWNRSTGTSLYSVGSISTGSDGNSSNWKTAYDHSQAAHAPTDAEKNVQADWNATSGDAFIQNKPTIPTDFVSKANGGTFSGNVTINGDTSTPHSDNAFIVKRGSNGNTSLRVQNSGEVVVENNYLYAAYNSGPSLYVQNAAVIRGGLQNDGGDLTVDDNLQVNGTGKFTGTLSIESTYPRINLTDTNHDDDWSIINNNGQFGIYNVTDAIYAFRIGTDNNTVLKGDLLPDADSTYDIGANNNKWAEGHFDHLYVGETVNNPRIDIYTEDETAAIADTFTDTTTDKSYIYFNSGTSSNDPGYIMHENSNASSPDERNEGVLHLCPSDDNGSTDYVSIHGTNDPDAIRLTTNGLIQSANGIQLVLQSDTTHVRIADSLDVDSDLQVDGNVNISGAYATIAPASGLNAVLNLNGDQDSFLEKDTGNSLYIANNSNNQDIYLRVKDNNSNVNALHIDGSENGNATFSGNIIMAANATVDGVDISALPTSFAPVNAEQNVQADWNATSGDALILNKPTIPTDHGDHDGLYIPVGGGQFSGALDFTPDTGAILKVDNQTILERKTANGAITIGHDDSIILAGGDTSSTMNSNINNAEETVFIGAEGGLKVFAFPDNLSGGWSARKEWRFQNNGVTVFPGNAWVGTAKYDLTVNAPTNLTTTIVNSTINVTFTASTTTNIDYYLVFSSVDGGDYGLISVIPPADFGATMSVIDDSFDATGTQAYRVYAVKNGVYSSPLTGSKSYSVITPLEPTNMSVVNLNTAYYVQWDPPSTNARFVTAYNVYKHEHATQGSLSRSSATLIYSGLNTSYMYQISGANNNNFHQFWVETTIA